MNFAQFFIHRPVFAAVLSIVMVLVGSIAMVELPVAQYPEVVPPTVVVRAIYPGASPKVLSETVATPIEQEVNGVEDMLYMSSTSTTDGVMSLTITFKLGTDLDKAQVLVQNRVNIASPKLPEEVRRLGVTVTKRSPNLTMVVHILSPDDSRDELYVGNFAFLQVKDQIARLPGVGDVAAAVEKDIVEWDEYTGRLEAKESVEIRARVSGYLDIVHFEEGKMVKVGDLLFTIDKRPYEAEKAALLADKDQAQTRADLAQSEFERAEKLIQSKAVSQEEFDMRVKTVAEARSAVKAAEARLAIAQLNLEFTEVRSPVAGRVGRALITVGNLIVGGTSGTTLLTTVVSLDPIYAYADVDERNILKYRRLAAAGTRKSAIDTHIPCQIGLSDEPGFPHEGVVDFVNNRINPNTGTVQGRAVIPNPSNLLVPGMFMRIRFAGSGEYKAVLIPDRALATDQAQRFVYVVDEESKAQFRPIKTGPVIDRMRVVKEGLKAGDKVITEGILNVRPGSPVTPVESANPMPAAP